MTPSDLKKNLAVVGSAEASEPKMEMFSQAARSAVRYADAMSWTAATAVGLALNDLTPELLSKRHEIGVITVSHHGPSQTIAAVAQAAAEGFSSPLRYPASNPGALAGVTCITHGLRGPTMNLTMPPAVGLPAAISLASSWIEKHNVPLVVLLASQRIGEGRFHAKCLLLGPVMAKSISPDMLSEIDLDWVASCADTTRVR
ncbi:MAG: hypothetical protein ABSH22_22330 [Tepidisphaeraceae bacterium]